MTVLPGLLVAGAVLATRFAPSFAVLGGLAALLVSTILMHRVSGLNPRRLTVPAFWYFTYVVGIFLPSYFVAADYDTQYVPAFLFAVISVLITAPYGMLLVNELSGFRKQEVAEFFAAPLERRAPRWSETASYAVVLLGCVALALAYVAEAPVIPLFYLIRNPGSVGVLVLLREESFKLLDSPLLYFYDVLRRVIFPFLIALSLGYWLLTRNRRWLVLFVVTAAVGTLYAALSAAKMPVAVIVLVACLFLYLYVGGRVSLRAGVLGFLGVFLFPVAVLWSSLEGLGVSFGLILYAIFQRLLYLPAEILYNYFEIVPDTLPFLHGRTIGRLSWVLGEPGFDIANYVFQYMYPGGIESGTATAPFLGYLHADFGVVGVLVGGVLAGVVLQLVQVAVTRRPKTVMTLAIYAFMYWGAWQMNAESLTQALLSGGIIVIFLFAGLLRQVSGLFETATGRSAAPPARPEVP